MAASDDRRGAAAAPFDTHLLDRLLDEAGIDVLIATSKHNVQYLLGGHRSFFFENMDAIGISRYLPAFVYPKGAKDKAGYFGFGLETFQTQLKPFWVSEVETRSGRSLDVTRKAADFVRRLGLADARIGVELAFAPADVIAALREALPGAKIKDASFALERLRLRKSPDELAMLRLASERVIESMLAVLASHGPGSTKNDLVEALRREETSRGLIFDYCLITAGTSFNRAPSDQVWQKGDPLSLDSGGNYHGYIGDITRMGIAGEPDAELVDLLAEVEAIQQASFKPIKAGVAGSEIYSSAHSVLNKSALKDKYEFVAHGMGLISHEGPRLSTTGPVPYDAYDEFRPLEAGMVLSIETTLLHPRRGFIKLEDTVAVTDGGYEIYGNGARGWNRAGR